MFFPHVLVPSCEFVRGSGNNSGVLGGLESLCSFSIFFRAVVWEGGYDYDLILKDK
jgi:hypothetical protein